MPAITVRLEPDLYERLRASSYLCHEHMSDILRTALEAHLDRLERETTAAAAERAGEAK